MSAEKEDMNTAVDKVEMPLERDWFTRLLVRELSGLLEEVVGLDEAAGFISVVGQNMGTKINSEYRKGLKVSHLNRQQINDVLVDLKHRIQGDFYIIEASEGKVVLGNRTCPFGEMVKDRPSLCMMTSNVFGTIAAENDGYAKIALEETIARGDAGCRVTVYFEESDEAMAADGREYFKSDI